MPEPSGGHVRSSRGRDEYRRYLAVAGVPCEQHPFYVDRVARFLRAAGDRDPRSLSERDVNEILMSLGRDETLLDWQFAQLVDAVRLYLVKFLGLTAAREIDWSYWKGSAWELVPAHASMARESRPEKLVRFKIREGRGSLASVRKQHEDLIVRFVTEIRARGYAFRTEEVHEQWVCRYIAFCGGQSPEEAGAESVTGFLNELVVSGNVSAGTQNQALNALVFTVRVLHAPLGQLENVARSKRKQLVPVVLTPFRGAAAAGGACGLAA